MKFYSLFCVIFQFYIGTSVKIKPKLKRNILNTESRKCMLELKAFCNKVKPFVTYYERLINSYNNTAHNILEKEIKLLLPQVKRKQKHGIITSLVSRFTGLAYEGISSFLHHK